jgi:hypothetical protein
VWYVTILSTIFQHGMWPFSTNRVPPELPELRAEIDELKRRVKLIEREHDDLHAAYRKLRGIRAQEAKDPVKPGSSDEPELTPKEALRKRAAAMMRRGNNSE